MEKFAEQRISLRHIVIFLKVGCCVDDYEDSLKITLAARQGTVEEFSLHDRVEVRLQAASQVLLKQIFEEDKRDPDDQPTVRAQAVRSW